MSVLGTGSEGYIGFELCKALSRENISFTGIDSGLFSECNLLEEVSYTTNFKDIRDIEKHDLIGVDSIIHLAAISNDPLGDLVEDLTYEINYEATIRLANLAKESGVRRFIFSSSCIMYGLDELEDKTEESSLDPQTIYARSKVLAEQDLLALASHEFNVISLRNGTVYGLSNKMRFDTVGNNFAGQIYQNSTIKLHGDGLTWRPVVLVEDVVNSMISMITRDIGPNDSLVLNNGSNKNNIQILDLAKVQRDWREDLEIEFLNLANADKRSYRANFDRLNTSCPDLSFKTNFGAQVQGLVNTFSKVPLEAEVVSDARFIRMKWLQNQMERGRVDEITLRVSS